MPLALQQQLGELADGNFVERGVNVLAFGLPGTGKTHALCAVGHCACVRADTVIDNRFYVVFFPCSKEVAHLFF